MRIILASRSPRRAALLREAGYDVVQAIPPFHDPPQPPEAAPIDPLRLALDLALQKGRSLLESPPFPLTDSDLIVAADTIVVAPAGTLLGQPHDRAAARRMLGLLIGHTHRVVTGVALLNPAGAVTRTFTDAAQVAIGMVPASQLEAYLDSGAWAGKAGAYNLAELANVWPIRVVGDPTTVVGLPMRMLRQRLDHRP